MRIWAVIRFQFEGVHRWIDAKEGVKFLSYPHRHMFHCEAWVEEKHDNRDVEFIEAKRYILNKVLNDAGFSLRMIGYSCEQIATDIIKFMKEKYGEDRKYKCSVAEDGENGSLVEEE